MVYTGRFLPDDIDCHTDSKGRMACSPNKGFACFFPKRLLCGFAYRTVLHCCLFFCKVFPQRLYFVHAHKTKNWDDETNIFVYKNLI